MRVLLNCPGSPKRCLGAGGRLGSVSPDSMGGFMGCHFAERSIACRRRMTRACSLMLITPFVRKYRRPTTKKFISFTTVLGLSAILCLGMAVPCMAKNPSTGCGYNVTSILYDSDSHPADNNLNFGTMTFTGQILACPMHLVFTYNGVLYNLGLAPPTWPGTSYMQVTCTGATGGQCNQWTVQPDPNTSIVNPQTNQLSGIAELFLPSCNGCGTGTALGKYLVSFSFLIHK